MTDRKSALTPSTDSPYWRGAVGWEHQGRWWQPWRLLPERVRRAHAPRLVEVARMPAGVRLQFRTDAAGMQLPIRSCDEQGGRLDVVVDRDLHLRVDLDPGTTEVDVPLPSGTHEVQVWLPQAGQIQVGQPRVHEASTCEPLPTGPRWVTYGSSITQCSAAYGPSQTWPAIVATNLGWDLTCLGYSGQCHLDPIAARTIAAVPADVITLCLGINIYGTATFNERSFAPHISGFIEQVREAHPGIPIGVMTPIVSPDRETTPNPVGQTLVGMRAAIEEVVESLREDDAYLQLIDGLQIFGADQVHLLPDQLHPDGQGYQLMGQRLTAELKPLIAAG
ncbi:MAG TPA: GDSL-type esterase/lipase family protein [Beutenbergiaceae bacterium]|nr:GDSL-type esterase/lipase family protein [Beutenbergiaceae bacterium]